MAAPINESSAMKEITVSPRDSICYQCGAMRGTRHRRGVVHVAENDGKSWRWLRGEMRYGARKSREKGKWANFSAPSASAVALGLAVEPTDTRF
jgi:hypothetical protein